MTTALASHHLAVIGRSSAGQPRTFRLEHAVQRTANRDAAYRRFAAAILGMDVRTLALELHSTRRRRTLTTPRVA